MAAANAGGSVILGLYRAVSGVCGPVLGIIARARLRRGKEDPARLAERFGHGSAPRPPGRVIWIHCASVGESLSVLALMDRLLAAHDDLSIVLTTGTVTSARLIVKRLPDRCRHQYVPFDHPVSVRRFLDHWRPDLAVWIESEFWPNLILLTRRRGIPMALVNGRISTASLRMWRRMPGTIRHLLSCFDLCLAQSDQAADRLRMLSGGGVPVEVPGNLKDDAPPLPGDPAALEVFRQALGDRPRWLAASTHEGEEQIAGHVHAHLLRDHPDLLTIVVPRHPARGAAIASALEAEGLTVARRSVGALPEAETQIYVADTMGELGVFYRLSPLAFMGGTLVPRGGQNPLEAGRLGCAVIHGPHGFNFTEAFSLLQSAGGATAVRDAAELAHCVGRLVNDPDSARREGEAARAAAAQISRVTETVAGKLLDLLPKKAGSHGEI